MLFAYYMNMGVAGFWYGYFVRSTLLASVYYYCIWYYYNWDTIALEVQEREKRNELGGPGPH
jgi:hypothetical protein